MVAQPNTMAVPIETATVAPVKLEGDTSSPEKSSQPSTVLSPQSQSVISAQSAPSMVAQPVPTATQASPQMINGRAAHICNDPTHNHPPGVPIKQDPNGGSLRHVQMRRKPMDITTAFKDAVILNNTSTPEVFLKYIESCSRGLYMGPQGINGIITKSEYEFKRYYTQTCLEIAFLGHFEHTPPEPIWINPTDGEATPEDGEATPEDGEATPEDGEGNSAIDNDETIDETKTEEKTEEVIMDERTRREDRDMPNVALHEYRPKVFRDREVIMNFRVPVKYQPLPAKVGAPEGETVVVPVIDPVQEGETKATLKTIIKDREGLTDEDKAFLKNQFLSAMHVRYRRFMEFSAQFEGMCHRGKELIRKMTSRRARKHFKVLVDKRPTGAVLDVTPSPKGNQDLRNVDVWFQEYCALYSKRGRLYRSILNMIGEAKRFQETPNWKYIVGEPVFDWKARTEKYILSAGTEDLLGFIKNAEVNFENEPKETDPVKDAVLYHFFEVNPQIIIQLAIARPVQDGLLHADLKKDADQVAE